MGLSGGENDGSAGTLSALRTYLYKLIDRLRTGDHPYAQ
jgi:hypothetical protein